MNRKTKPKYRQILLKNNQSDLQATLLSLLSYQCAFEITKSQRKSFVTKEFLKIKNIFFHNEIIDCREFKKNRFSELKIKIMKEEKISEKNFNHRLEQIRRSEIMHLLEDILNYFGCFVIIEKEETNGISGLCSIYIGDIIVKESEFSEIAEGVRDFVRKKMGNQKSVIIKQNELVPFFLRRKNS